MKIMLINGVNLNFLGIREKGIYGNKDFATICAELEAYAKEKDIDLTLFQSNSEGEIVDCLQKAYLEKYDGVIINPGAHTHYSIAIFDAIKSISLPCVEVHLSNVHAREEFRKNCVTTGACIGQICGFGDMGYKMAIDALVAQVK